VGRESTPEVPPAVGWVGDVWTLTQSSHQRRFQSEIIRVGPESLYAGDGPGTAEEPRHRPPTDAAAGGISEPSLPDSVMGRALTTKRVNYNVSNLNRDIRVIMMSSVGRSISNEVIKRGEGRVERDLYPHSSSTASTGTCQCQPEGRSVSRCCHESYYPTRPLLRVCSSTSDIRLDAGVRDSESMILRVRRCGCHRRPSSAGVPVASSPGYYSLSFPLPGTVNLKLEFT
jgi:hypothetical protein